MKTIAITGQSGSGKTKISDYLRDRGFIVIDTDKLAKQIRFLMIDKIKEEFGEQYIENGDINNKKLSLLVFNDRIELNKLNDIMFPEIRKKIEEIILEHKQKGTNLLFFDIGALFSSGSEKYFDYIVLVIASFETRLNRLIEFRKIDRLIAEAQVDSINITPIEMSRCSLIILNEKNKEQSEVFEKMTSWINNIKDGINSNDGENRTN